MAAGAELTISGFVNTYGSWVSVFTAIAMCCFAFSTIIGWGLYGTRFRFMPLGNHRIFKGFINWVDMIMLQPPVAKKKLKIGGKSTPVFVQ